MDRRRHRPSQPSVLSTIHLRGITTKPVVPASLRPSRKQASDPVVDAVGEHDREPAVEALDPLQQIPGAVSVLDIGGMDEDTEQEAGGIDPKMALAALDLLGSVVAARPPFSVVLRLWVSMITAVGLASRPSRSVMTR